MPKVLVIIPAYNESETIAGVLSALEKHVPGYDVLVIDDGSVDGTAAIVSRHPGVALMRMPYNVGIGTTMQTGYRHAHRENYDICVQCDADGQHPVHQMKGLVESVQDGVADLVIGSRYVSDTKYKPSFSRRVGKSLLSRLVNSVTDRGGITDTTSGFRAMNRAVFSIFAYNYPDDYPEAEALVILHKYGLSAAEVPVDMEQRQGGKSSIIPRRAAYYIVKVSLAILIDVFKTMTRAPSAEHDRTQGAQDNPTAENRPDRS